MSDVPGDDDAVLRQLAKHARECLDQPGEPERLPVGEPAGGRRTKAPASGTNGKATAGTTPARANTGRRSTASAGGATVPRLCDVPTKDRTATTQRARATKREREAVTTAEDAEEALMRAGREPPRAADAPATALGVTPTRRLETDLAGPADWSWKQWRAGLDEELWQTIQTNLIALEGDGARFDAICGSVARQVVSRGRLSALLLCAPRLALSDPTSADEMDAVAKDLMRRRRTREALDRALEVKGAVDLLAFEEEAVAAALANHARRCFEVTVAAAFPPMS